MEQNNYNNAVLDKKLDLILQELSQHGKKFSDIDKRFDNIDKKFSDIDKRFDNIDKRITSLKSDNLREHAQMNQLLTSLNSAFLRYETEGLDKINILFDADRDRKNHQDIFEHELQRLNDLIAKNSLRISNLEQHL